MWSVRRSIFFWLVRGEGYDGLILKILSKQTLIPPPPIQSEISLQQDQLWFWLCSWVKRLYQLFWTWSHYNVFDNFFFSFKLFSFFFLFFLLFFFFALEPDYERHHGIFLSIAVGSKQQSAEVKRSNTVASLLWFTLHSKPAREKTPTQFTFRLRRRKWASYFELGHPEPSLTMV